MCGKCEQHHKSPYVYGQARCYQAPVCAQVLCDVTPKKVCRPAKIPCECIEEFGHGKHGKHEKKRLKREAKAEKHFLKKFKKHDHDHDHDGHKGCAGSCKPCVSHFVRPAANCLPYPRHLNLCA